MSSVAQMIAAQQTVSSYFIDNEHISEAIYFNIDKLVQISEQSANYEKVNHVLQLTLILWVNNSCYINCAQKRTVSHLSQIISNMS